MKCGYCQGDVLEAQVASEGRCICGRRAITRLPSGALVHRDGCDGRDGCPCLRGLEAMSARIGAIIAEFEQRVATVHERVRCPRCSAPVGVRCRSMPRGYRPLDGPDRVRTLRSSHKQRLRADGVYER